MTTTAEKQTQVMDLARTILNQIKAGDGWALGAWGARGFYAISENKEFQGGLGFKVNGLAHKGWVTVKLRWLDDYTISFIDKMGQIVKTVEGAYCDQLVEIIDFVEGK